MHTVKSRIKKGYKLWDCVKSAFVSAGRGYGCTVQTMGSMQHRLAVTNTIPHRLPQACVLLLRKSLRVVDACACVCLPCATGILTCTTALAALSCSNLDPQNDVSGLQLTTVNGSSVSSSLHPRKHSARQAVLGQRRVPAEARQATKHCQCYGDGLPGSNWHPCTASSIFSGADALHHACLASIQKRFALLASAWTARPLRPCQQALRMLLLMHKELQYCVCTTCAQMACARSAPGILVYTAMRSTLPRLDTGVWRCSILSVSQPLHREMCVG